MSRLDSIRKLLAASPQDAFLLYSLGMELLGEASLDEAAGQFRRLLELDPQYLPAYAQLGETLQQLGDIDGARDAFDRGIEVARTQGDRHSADRLELLAKSLGTPDRSEG